MMTQETPPPTAERKSHPFYTYDMIFEIPQAMRDTLQNSREKISAIMGRLTGRELFYFTGCGTALFAAMLGAQVFSFAKSARFRSLSVPALELANYDYLLDKSSVAIAVSHSGITKTTIDALRFAKAKGAFCIGVTHFPGSSVSQVADVTMIAGNGPDKSRCHTKCYVASAIACTEIGIELLKHSDGALPERLERLEAQLNELPQVATKVLNSTDKICERLAEEHSKKQCYYFAGAGPNVPNTLEAALKIMETSFVQAQGFETEQLLHGPWVSLDDESVLIVLAPKGSCHQRNVDLVKAAKTVGARVIAMADQGDDEIASLCDDAIELPVVDEYMSPFVNIIPLYLFAYYSSVKRGINPDLLRYLTPSYWEARQIIFPPGTH